jgi:hypothetical protein
MFERDVQQEGPLQLEALSILGLRPLVGYTMCHDSDEALQPMRKWHRVSQEICLIWDVICLVENREIRLSPLKDEEPLNFLAAP